MKVKYNRVSTLNQSGNRFQADEDKYDKVILDKVSGTIPFNEREGGKEILKHLNENKLHTLVIEELARMGRNTADVINTLSILDKGKVNVVVRNIGLQSRPNGKRNPVWKMITSVMSSIYEMELENIKERTHYGRMVYIKNGGKLGRPKGTKENIKTYLNKDKSKLIIRYLQKGYTVREIMGIMSCSPNTIKKVKDTYHEMNVL